MTLEVMSKNGGDSFISFRLMLVQKQTVPHMKAPILIFLVLDGQGHVHNYYEDKMPTSCKRFYEHEKIKVSLSMPNRVKV